MILVDEENTYYNQRGNRTNETSPTPSRGGGNNSMSNSKFMGGNQNVRPPRQVSHEEESRTLQERLFEDMREVIAAENEKLRDEIQPVFGEIIKQVRHITQARSEDNEKIEDMKLETDEIIRILTNVCSRMDKIEQKFFPYEMDILDLKDKRSVAITQNRKWMDLTVRRW